MNPSIDIKLDLLGKEKNIEQETTQSQIIITIERRGRKSKTLVENLGLSKSEQESLVKLLRKKACCSVSYKEDILKLHGDQRDLIADHLLNNMGYTKEQIIQHGL
jgi:translation initiation factor 1 (eIF-1/SUI1)